MTQFLVKLREFVGKLLNAHYTGAPYWSPWSDFNPREREWRAD